MKGFKLMVSGLSLVLSAMGMARLNVSGVVRIGTNALNVMGQDEFLKRMTMRMTMNLKVRKWGNSLAIRIPALLAKQLDWREGTSVNLYVKNKCLIVERARPKYTLSELLEGYQNA